MQGAGLITRGCTRGDTCGDTIGSPNLQESVVNLPPETDLKNLCARVAGPGCKRRLVAKSEKKATIPAKKKPRRADIQYLLYLQMLFKPFIIPISFQWNFSRLPILDNWLVLCVENNAAKVVVRVCNHGAKNKKCDL